MFVGSQTIPGSWGRNFFVSKFEIILINIKKKNACIYIRGVVNSCASATYKRHEHWSPQTIMIPQYLCNSPHRYFLASPFFLKGSVN